MIFLFLEIAGSKFNRGIGNSFDLTYGTLTPILISNNHAWILSSSPTEKRNSFEKPCMPHRQPDISQANNVKSKTSNPKAIVLGHAAKKKPTDPPLIRVGLQPDLIPIITNPTSNPNSVAQILPNKPTPTTHPLSKTQNPLLI